MTKIAPSILSADFMRLGEELRAARSAGADMLHLDVMDGHFVPNMTIGPFIVEAIRKNTDLPLDVHLMIEEPDRYLQDFINAGANYLTVHAEATLHLHRTVHWIRENGARAGVSLNPATPVVDLENIIADVDLILIMSVNPGFGGQSFIPRALDKVKAVKKLLFENSAPALIEVDGGIKLENAREVTDAGADILVMGSGFFHAGDYGDLMKRLRERLDGR
jgi:ribulose-phosphate 3-epimerase